MNIIRFKFPGIPSVECLFEGRDFCDSSNAMAGNVSYAVGDDERNVAACRQRLLAICARDKMDTLCETWQSHGVNVIEEPRNGSSDILPEADGMLTCQPGCGLMIKTADCQPILLARKSGRQIMAIHVGWRGNRNNFPSMAVDAFCQKYCARPDELMAVRGPSLGPADAEFVNFTSEWGEDFAPWYDRQTRCMDLWRLTRDQLIGAGLKKEAIFGLDICTKKNFLRYFSYRHDKKCGRQASLIWIRNE